MKTKRGPSFKPEFIRAILNTKPDTWPPEPIDDSKPYKWQTRRLVKPQPKKEEEASGPIYSFYKAEGKDTTYQPDQVYYVREPVFNFEDSSGAVMAYSATSTNAIGHIAEDDNGNLIPWQKKNGEPYKIDKLPGIYMPECAARIFITIKNVRIERVQDITPEDTLAEGIMEGEFKLTWKEIHDEESWNANPWVWVYEFKRESGIGNLN